MDLKPRKQQSSWHNKPYDCNLIVEISLISSKDEEDNQHVLFGASEEDGEFRTEAMAKMSRAPGCAGDLPVTVVETVPCTSTIYFMVRGPSARACVALPLF